MGLQIDSLELIGYDPETDTFPSMVYSNLSPAPLPYRWEVDGDNVTITVSFGPLDATFTGSWRADGTFSGGWRPNPSAMTGTKRTNHQNTAGSRRQTIARRSLQLGSRAWGRRRA